MARRRPVGSHCPALLIGPMARRWPVGSHARRYSLGPWPGGGLLALIARRYSLGPIAPRYSLCSHSPGALWWSFARHSSVGSHVRPYSLGSWPGATLLLSSARRSLAVICPALVCWLSRQGRLSWLIARRCSVGSHSPGLSGGHLRGAPWLALTSGPTLLVIARRCSVGSHSLGALWRSFARRSSVGSHVTLYSLGSSPGITLFALIHQVLHSLPSLSRLYSLCSSLLLPCATLLLSFGQVLAFVLSNRPLMRVMFSVLL
jgi:hypothetical protein